jgi:tetratricopeptide (TPR) repeat protein
MQCKNHPKKEASAVCVECGKAVCGDCDFVLLRKRYCKECATRWLLAADEGLKLVTPDVVTCDICGRARGYDERFYVCDKCGAVACPSHWYESKRTCQKCYDEWLDGEVKKWAQKGLTRPCPSCGTQNLLNAKTCRDRQCEADLPYLHDAVEIRSKNIPCAHHPRNPAYVKCISCGKYLCLDCQTTYRNANYCGKCLATLKAAEIARRKKIRRRVAIGVLSGVGAIVVVLGILCVAGSIVQAHTKKDAYAAAKHDYVASRYEASLTAFRKLEDYKDAEKWAGAAEIMLVRGEVGTAKTAEAAGDYVNAAEHYNKASAHDPRFEPSYRRCKARANIGPANAEIAEATKLAEKVKVKDAASGRGGYEDLCAANEKAAAAVNRLNEAKTLAPNDGEVLAALAVAEAERDRLGGIRERVEKRRSDIAAEEIRKEEAKKRAEERRSEAERKAGKTRERRAAERERDDANNYMVYVTDSGGKYHSAGCRYLRKSSHPMKVKDARTSGYSP